MNWNQATDRPLQQPRPGQSWESELAALQALQRLIGDPRKRVEVPQTSTGEAKLPPVGRRYETR
jgi:hypothetical protein